MNSRTSASLVVVVGLLLLAGCAAGGAMLGRAAIGGAARSAVAGSALRMGAASFGGRAVASGVLRSGLRSLTAGRASAAVSMTRSGAILHRGRLVASLESDGLLVARQGGQEYAVGRLAHNRLYSLTSSGDLGAPVARLRGFVPGRGVSVRSGPTPNASRVEVLRGNVTAEVLQVRDGWYEIRLANQSTGWVWGTLLALALVDDDEAKEPRIADHATDVLLVLQSGQSVRAHEITVDGSIIRVRDVHGTEFVFDRSVVSHAVPFRELPETEETSTVSFIDGTAVIGSARVLDGGAVEINATTGSSLVADSSLILQQ